MNMRPKTVIFTHGQKWSFFILASAGALLLWILSRHIIAIDPGSFYLAWALMVLLLAVGFAYLWSGRDQAIGDISIAIAQFLIFSNIAVLINYAGLTLHRPLFDETFSRIDQSLGLDWRGYVNFVKHIPIIGTLLTYAYLSSIVQLVINIAVLSFLKQRLRLERIILSLMISSCITIAFFTWFPNFGALALYYKHGNPPFDFYLALERHATDNFYALYDGPIPVLKFNDLDGIIGCPSFHTVLAILAVYGFWSVPYLRWVAVVLNLAVLVAVPADGGHYFIDIAAGAVVAVATLWLVYKILPSGTGNELGQNQS